MGIFIYKTAHTNFISRIKQNASKEDYVLVKDEIEHLDKQYSYYLKKLDEIYEAINGYRNIRNGIRTMLKTQKKRKRDG